MTGLNIVHSIKPTEKNPIFIPYLNLPLKFDMSKKRSNPFSFLDSSDTESASEGEMPSSISIYSKKLKNECEVEILKVEPGHTSCQVEIVKVEHPPPRSPDVEIIKVVPGTSKNWP